MDDVKIMFMPKVINIMYKGGVMRRNILLLLFFFLIILLVGCCKKNVFSGIIISQTIYRYDNNDKYYLAISDGDIIELDEIENGACSILCRWKYIFKNYSELSVFPEIKYYKNQAIIYYVYFNDELIETNYDETITELEKGQIIKNNQLFKWESICSYILLFTFKANQYGRYRIVLEVNLIVDEVEENVSNELNFIIK